MPQPRFFRQTARNGGYKAYGRLIRLRQLLNSGATTEREQKSWDAGLSGTKRDGCGTNPEFAGFFVGAAAEGGAQDFWLPLTPLIVHSVQHTLSATAAATTTLIARPTTEP